MRKGRRERIEKGSRGDREETKRQFEEREGLRDPTLIRISRSDLFLQVLRVKLIQAYRMHYCHGVKQNVKKCAIGETEILSLYLRKTENLSEEKEGMGERRGGEERGLRKGAERREKRQKGAELTI